MMTENFLGIWTKRFLVEYLISIRNCSVQTQKSYRDTFRILVAYLSIKSKKPIDQLTLDDMESKGVIEFLLYLEKKRHCSINTRNQRLAALRSFALYVSNNNPTYIEWCRQIRLIPLKKFQQTEISFLEKEEIKALLTAPDRSTTMGRRDYALLLFLYNTGVRASEAANLIISDIEWSSTSERKFSTVVIKGKGNKIRRCPLWQITVDALSSLIEGRQQNEHVFQNYFHKPLTRSGIYKLIKKHIEVIAEEFPSLQLKAVSTHTIRHTTATHLVRSGTDINTIRAWLGHVSLDTTNIYANVDLEMKAEALKCCEVEDNLRLKHWRNNKGLMAFLNSL